MAGSIWGWLILVGSAIMEFLGGYETELISVVLAIAVDLVWGIAAAVKQGKFTKSELMRETVGKITGYLSVVLLFILAEKCIPGDSFWVSGIVTAIIIATEAWSICGNVLIVFPNAVFFKLLKPALKGELASKLGVSEDKVDEILTQSEKKRKSKKKND